MDKIRGKLPYRIFYDLEFQEDGETIKPISIGLIRIDGISYYAEFAEYDKSKATDWLKTNVMPNLSGETKPKQQIADEVSRFLLPPDGYKTRLYGYYSAYDHVALCQLFGTMIGLPNHVPMWTYDIKQLAETIGYGNFKTLKPGKAHNALADARWHLDMWQELKDFVLSQPDSRLHVNL